MENVPSEFWVSQVIQNLPVNYTYRRNICKKIVDAEHWKICKLSDFHTHSLGEKCKCIFCDKHCEWFHKCETNWMYFMTATICGFWTVVRKLIIIIIIIISNCSNIKTINFCFVVFELQKLSFDQQDNYWSFALKGNACQDWKREGKKWPPNFVIKTEIFQTFFDLLYGKDFFRHEYNLIYGFYPRKMAQFNVWSSWFGESIESVSFPNKIWSSSSFIFIFYPQKFSLL